MVSLDTEVVNDLKSKVNIADLISQYVALSRTGKNYIGLCPFHGEKTPSFNVNAEKGFYHCFGCGRSGDAIEFLKEYNQVGFVDAVKELADFAGVTLNISDDREEKNNPNAPLFEINNQAARLYNILLMSTELGERARKYLEERGITDDVIKRFNIGLAPKKMILFLKIYQISLMKKLWQSLVYFISQIIMFLMLLRIESCFQSPTNMDIQLVFLDVNGRKMMILKPNILILQQQLYLINLMNFGI